MGTQNKYTQKKEQNKRIPPKKRKLKLIHMKYTKSVKKWTQDSYPHAVQTQR
jgi:hypothetical protein